LGGRQGRADGTTSPPLAGPEPALRAEGVYVTSLAQAKSSKMAHGKLTLHDEMRSNVRMTVAGATSQRPTSRARPVLSFPAVNVAFTVSSDVPLTSTSMNPASSQLLAGFGCGAPRHCRRARGGASLLRSAGLNCRTRHVVPPPKRRNCSSDVDRGWRQSEPVEPSLWTVYLCLQPLSTLQGEP
jgi:hypothetical protein